MKLSLKYKLLLVFLLVVVAGMSSYFYITRKTFLEDKKLFVLDWSITNLKASTAQIKFDLKTRLDDLQALLPKLFNATPQSEHSQNLFSKEAGGRLEDELLRVSFYQKSGDQFVLQKTQVNMNLLNRLSISEDRLQDLRALSFEQLLNQTLEGEGLKIVNRTKIFDHKTKQIEVPILTLFYSDNSNSTGQARNIIVIDLLQQFLQKSLNQSELAQIFLVSKTGELVSHSDPSTLKEFSTKPFDHPVTSRLKTSSLPRESFELAYKGQDYLMSFSATGISDLIVVSQIKKSDAFRALQTLTKQSLNIGFLILSLALVASVIFSSALTQNIKKLELAAKTIGEGNFDVKVNIRSGDEVEKVASSFEWMTQKIVALLKETAEKARMQEELATASLIQNTILTPPEMSEEKNMVVPFYKSASECGGDLWDAFVKDGKLTVLLGDATGHGAPAAIVTAVVKSCVSTLNELKKQQNISPDELLACINQIVYQSCKGQLLMTMSICQLDLSTGELLLANAGHEAPFKIKSNKVESLFVKGERLGHSPDSMYSSISVSLTPGDSILVYSDGLSEAHNPNGQLWGERALKKTYKSLAHLPLEDIKNGILEKLNEFTQSTPQPDDITFVLFGWKKPVLSSQTTEPKAA